MSDRSPEPTGQMMPLEGNAKEWRSTTAASPLGSRLMTIDADRRMGEMELSFSTAGTNRDQTEALATLRRWESNPRLDSATRLRARALVWRYEPNGWDEV